MSDDGIEAGARFIHDRITVTYTAETTEELMLYEAGAILQAASGRLWGMSRADMLASLLDKLEVPRRGKGRFAALMLTCDKVESLANLIIRDGDRIENLF